ncbi:Protein kinase, partial [Phytophthora palmivora]
MGCSSSKARNDPRPPQTGRYEEPNYSNLAANVNNGDFSANHNGNMPRRSVPAPRNARNQNL